ncbi:MAG: hypothetical protein SX243_08245 [Acidobacteriota bacterium]|nr:hypothetical protein [Acidobacteriota bacterium]
MVSNASIDGLELSRKELVVEVLAQTNEVASNLFSDPRIAIYVVAPVEQLQLLEVVPSEGLGIVDGLASNGFSIEANPAGRGVEGEFEVALSSAPRSGDVNLQVYWLELGSRHWFRRHR